MPRLNRGSWSISGKFNYRGRSGKRVFPKIHLLFDGFALQPFPLPGRIVGILDRQLCEARRFAVNESAIKLPQLAEENTERQLVRDDAMRGQQKNVIGDPICIAKANQYGPQQRTEREIEWCLSLLSSKFLGPCDVCGRRVFRQLNNREIN